MSLLEAENRIRRLGLVRGYSDGDAIKLALDALCHFRNLALSREEEITRLNAELIEVRNSAHYNRIFGGHP
jgi:hypothetical protein